MAEIQMFRAFHYGSRFQKNMAGLICPPYDVINHEEQKKFFKQHKNNFIRVELPLGDPLERYRNAARVWKDWQKQGIIERDGAPCFYLYEARFRSELDGRAMVRRGFFAALRLVPWGKGVHPHEKTLPTPKADRLKLFKSLRAQTSPIQCLFEDASKKASVVLARHMRGPCWLSYEDSAGVTHSFWRLEKCPDALVLRDILKRAPVSIADGHHRYETSRAYSQWARKKWGAKLRASNYVMTFLTAADDKGLEVLATPRAVGWNKREFVKLAEWGELKPLNGMKDLKSLMKGKKNGAGALSVGVYKEGKFYQYQFSSVPPSLRKTPSAKLAVACLHAGPLDGLGKEDFFFSRQPEAAVERAKANNGWAFFLAPNTVQEVLNVATAGHVMPPKSTYFYPKIPSGIVSHSLYGDL